MQKVSVKSSFMSPVTGKAKPQPEFKAIRQAHCESRIASLDKKIRRALRRGNLDLVQELTIKRNETLRSQPFNKGVV